MDLRITCSGEIDLGYTWVLQKTVAHLLRGFAQGGFRGVAIKFDVEDFAAASRQRNLWFLGIVREGADPVYLLFDLLVGFLLVYVSQQLDAHRSAALASSRCQLLDPFQPAHGFLDYEHDTLFNLFGAGSRVGDADRNPVELELGKDLFLDLPRNEEAAQQ